MELIQSRLEIWMEICWLIENTDRLGMNVWMANHRKLVVRTWQFGLKYTHSPFWTSAFFWPESNTYFISTDIFRFQFSFKQFSSKHFAHKILDGKLASLEFAAIFLLVEKFSDSDHFALVFPVWTHLGSLEHVSQTK